MLKQPAKITVISQPRGMPSPGKPTSCEVLVSDLEVEVEREGGLFVRGLGVKITDISLFFKQGEKVKNGDLYFPVSLGLALIRLYVLPDVERIDFVPLSSDLWLLSKDEAEAHPEPYHTLPKNTSATLWQKEV